MTGSCSVLTRRWHHGCHPSLSLTACSVSHSATTHQDPALGWSGTPHPQHPWVGVSLHPIRPGCVRCHRWVTIGDPWWFWGHWGTHRDSTQHLTAQPGQIPFEGGTEGDIGVSPRLQLLTAPKNNWRQSRSLSPSGCSSWLHVDALPGQDPAQPIPN